MQFFFGVLLYIFVYRYYYNIVPRFDFVNILISIIYVYTIYRLCIRITENVYIRCG